MNPSGLLRDLSVYKERAETEANILAIRPRGTNFNCIFIWELNKILIRCNKYQVVYMMYYLKRELNVNEEWRYKKSNWEGEKLSFLYTKKKRKESKGWQYDQLLLDYLEYKKRGSSMHDNSRTIHPTRWPKRKYTTSIGIGLVSRGDHAV